MPIAVYIILALTLFRLNDVFADQPAPALQTALVSKTGAVIKIHKHRSSFVVDYVLNSNGHTSSNKRTIIKVPYEIARSQFFDAKAITAFNDAVPAIEVTGECGNKVCEKLIYRFNESHKAYQLFFRGAYTSVSVFDGHLIEAGASGCCAFEYHAYKLPEAGSAIAESPQIMIEVTSNPVSTSTDAVECTFTNAAGENIEVPNRDWLEFCKVYGESYRLKR